MHEQFFEEGRGEEREGGDWERGSGEDREVGTCMRKSGN